MIAPKSTSDRSGNHAVPRWTGQHHAVNPSGTHSGNIHKAIFSSPFGATTNVAIPKISVIVE
jgi:hypothetical protein